MATYLDKLQLAFRALEVRGLEVAPRLDYLEGRHASQLGSAAWNASFRDIVSGIVDNQVALVVETRAEAIGVQGVAAVDTDPLSEALATWATELLTEEAENVAHALRMAEATGVQTTVLVDYNSRGEVSLYNVDCRSVYVHVDNAGQRLWAVHVWRDDDDTPTSVTLYLPTETVVLRSTVLKRLPNPATFVVVDTLPNPLGEVAMAVVDKRGSLVDRIRPLNDLLNRSLQTQAVVGEAYALPFRVFIGVETYDPHTGEVSGALPQLNPATGGRDLSFPTSVDAEGGQVSVQQLPSPDPSKYLAEQESLRLAIARQGYTPSSQLQLGGGRPQTAEALEIENQAHRARTLADRRVYGPFVRELARLAIRRRLYQVTGTARPAPQVRVLWTDLDTNTATSRMDMLRTAVEAGMSLADALVHFLGWTPEAAEQIMANAATEAANRAALADQRFEAGGL